MPLLYINSTGFMITPQVGHGDEPPYIDELTAILNACSSRVSPPSPSNILTF
jgi:hypothetical protein